MIILNNNKVIHTSTRPPTKDTPTILMTNIINETDLHPSPTSRLSRSSYHQKSPATKIDATSSEGAPNSTTNLQTDAHVNITVLLADAPEVNQMNHQPLTIQPPPKKRRRSTPHDRNPAESYRPPRKRSPCLNRHSRRSENPVEHGENPTRRCLITTPPSRPPQCLKLTPERAHEPEAPPNVTRKNPENGSVHTKKKIYRPLNEPAIPTTATMS